MTDEYAEVFGVWTDAMLPEATDFLDLEELGPLRGGMTWSLARIRLEVLEGRTN